MNKLKELRLEKGYTQIKMQMLTGIDKVITQSWRMVKDIIHLNNAENLQ